MSGRDISVAPRLAALPLLAAAAIAVLGLTGCSNQNPGTPTPTSGTSAGDPSTTTAQGASDNWWQSVNACNLLDQTTATGLGYPQPGQVQDGQKSNCAWTAADGSTFGIVLEGQAYNSHPADMGQQSQVTVASRPAVQNAQIGGSDNDCGLAIEATKGSDANIVVNTLGSTVAEACTLAQNIGTAIAPKLPARSN
jgi:hypothetical protein